MLDDDAVLCKCLLSCLGSNCHKQAEGLCQIPQPLHQPGAPRDANGVLAAVLGFTTSAETSDWFRTVYRRRWSHRQSSTSSSGLFSEDPLVTSDFLTRESVQFDAVAAALATLETDAAFSQSKHCIAASHPRRRQRRGGYTVATAALTNVAPPECVTSIASYVLRGGVRAGSGGTLYPIYYTDHRHMPCMLYICHSKAVQRC